MSKLKLFFVIAQANPKYYFNLSFYCAIAFIGYSLIGAALFFSNWNIADLTILNLSFFFIAVAGVSFKRSIETVYRFHIFEDAVSGMIQGGFQMRIDKP